MTIRRLSCVCASIVACIALAQAPMNAYAAPDSASLSPDNAQQVDQVRFPDGELRKDRSHIGQARPNANYNTLKVYPMLPPAQPANAGGASPRGEPPPCELEPCEILIFDNFTGPNSAGAIDNQGTPLYDDCALAGSDRFICRISLALGGLNNSGGLLPITLIVRSGNYFPICPEDSRSVVLYTATQNVPMTNPFNVINYDINPPIFLDENFFWIGVQTPPEANDAGWGIGGPAEIGFTENNIVIPNNNGTCEDLGPGQMDDYFWYGGDPYAGMQTQIFANPGPPGACCERDIDLGGGMAQCTDAVFRSTCLSNTTNIWKPGLCEDFGSEPACEPCLSQDGACAGADPEGEADCGPGSVDSYNADCSISGLPTLACGQRICGSAGTYASACTDDTDCSAGVTCVSNICAGPDNARDNDWYRIILTETTEVTVRVTARFAFQVTVMNNGGDPNTCTDEPLDFESGRACETKTIVRCLPAGTWYVRVRPDTFSGVPCSTRYRLELDCAGCALVAGACCDASVSGCSELAEVACLGRNGQYQGDGTTCAVEGADCPGVPANDNCTAQIPLAGQMVSVSYDTSFATDSTSPSGSPVICEGEINVAPVIRRDIFYRYQIPTNFDGTPITQGTVVISTNDQPKDPHDPAFDSWVVVYGDPSTTNPCSAGTLCSRPQLTCSDDILDNGTNFKFNALSYLSIPVFAGSNEFFDPGDCIMIRIGRGASPVTPASPTGGPGWLNIDFIPRSAPYTLQTGRCCLPDTNDCVISISDMDCVNLGGYPRGQVDYNQGDPSVVEKAAGCKAAPCPQPGEACYRALDFNDLVSGDEGTITQAISDILYYKYEVPAVGAVIIHTCGSTGFFDPIVGVYASLLANGDCDLSSLIQIGDDCTATNSEADGALTSAPCYGGINATADACICLSVGPGLDVQAGQIIYIAYGSSNRPGKQFVFAGSPREIVDPVTNPIDAPVNSVLAIVTDTQCFSCPATCPMGALDEGSDFTCGDTNDPNPQDLHNGGCNATPPSFNGPTIDCSGGPVQICGRAGNYQHPFPCDTPLDCPSSEPCSGPGGFCIGPARFVNRDEDWYRIVVDQPRTINWRVVSAEFAAELAIFADPEGDCANLFALAANSVDFACAPPEGTPTTLEVSASVCAGTYYMVVRPSVFGGLGSTACDAEYVVEASCDTFVQPATCCVGDMNGDGYVNGLDIQKWISVLFTPPSVFDSFLGCFAPNYCRGDINSSGLIDLGDLPDFVGLLVTADKPVCTLGPDCSDPATSQQPSDSTGVTISDIDLSADDRAAECFKPLESGNITTVCWWGAYVDIGGLDCGPEPDCFQITFYSTLSGCDNTAGNRCPGTRICPTNMSEPVCSQYVGNATRTATGGAIITPAGLVTEYFYSATLANPVSVSAGQCYWIEIVNNTPMSSCFWNWEQSPQGDSRHATANVDPATGDLPTDYSSCGVQPRDLAFSINLRIDKGGCARPQGRCCYDVPPIGELDCQVTTEENCVAILNGQWSEDGTCTPVDPACVVGRCCYLDEFNSTQCVSTLITTCTSLGGLWTEGASCPCPTGRCCVGTDCTAPISEIECQAIGGAWLEGATCAQPCPTGICNNVNRCQAPHLIEGLQQGGYVSDADNEVTTADDFRPVFTSGANFINQVCWRGFHRSGTADCGGDASVSETFTITYYATSGVVPDTSTIIGGPFNVTPLKSAPVPAEGVVGGGNQWQYEAFHDPVPVTAAQCYWVEIVNTVVDSSCVFVWATSNEGGNQRGAIRKTGGAGAFPYQVVDRDLAFCLGPVNLTSAACPYSPSAPANDQCSNATFLGVGPVAATAGTTLGASLDPGATSGCGVAANTRDVYYTWTQGPSAVATTFLLCSINTTFDATLSVHRTSWATNGCPVSSASGSQISTIQGCNDDGCPIGLGTNQLFFQGRQPRVSLTNAQAGNQLQANQTFLIRIGGATKGGPSNNPPDGNFTIQITQP